MIFRDTSALSGLSDDKLLSILANGNYLGNSLINSYTDTSIPATGNYYYAVIPVNTTANVNGSVLYFGPIQVTKTTTPPEGIDPLVIILIVLVVVIGSVGAACAALFVLHRTGKIGGQGKKSSPSKPKVDESVSPKKETPEKS
jgi:hypothetical protein